ncbi:MAG: ATP-binding protein, partial [Candidatus Heimdallarchaeota archaeon]|nr:ATP-binding protein [Candidatus Heimdallarchaeota archaeon]
MVLNITGDAEKTTGQLKESLEQKIQQAESKLDSITKKIKQSQVEVDKLAKRQVANSAKIRNIKENAEELSPIAVRDAYEEALDAQQRLFVMRGQMEKFNNEQVHLQDFIMQMQDISAFLVKTPLLEEGEVELNAAEVIESVIQAQEAERHKLSSKMHDGPAQALSNFILQAEIAQRLFDMDLDQARAELDDLKANANATFVKVRDFIFELRPMMLDDLGLIPTLRHYIEALKEQNETEIHFSASGTERRLDGYLEIMLFRAVQELVSNAARHSKADTIRIHIDTGEEKIVVDVEDDGKGFNVEQAMESSMG